MTVIVRAGGWLFPVRQALIKTGPWRAVYLLTTRYWLIVLTFAEIHMQYSSSRLGGRDRNLLQPTDFSKGAS
jgi:hypothetical protein